MVMTTSEISSFIDQNPMPKAWFKAAEYGHTEVLTHLLSTNEVSDIDMLDEESLRGESTALHIAIRHNRDETVRYLCTKEAKLDLDAQEGEHQLNALFMAIYLRRMSILDYLLTNYPGLIKTRGFYGYTPLQAAVTLFCTWKNLDIIKLLIARGCNAQDQLDDGSYILDWCMAGNISLPEGVGSDTTIIAAHLSMIEYLLENGADAAKATKPLVTAAYVGALPIVEKLCEAGIDVNHKAECNYSYNDKISALLAATRQGHGSIVKYLTQVPGIDLNCTSSNDRTPLHWAVYLGHDSITQHLWQQMHVNRFTRESWKGMTVFHMAVFGEQLDIVKWLITVIGEDKLAVDAHGRDALQIAAFYSRSRGKTSATEIYLRQTNFYTPGSKGRYHQTADEMNPKGASESLESSSTANNLSQTTIFNLSDNHQPSHQPS